jgi:hypothetical protein
MKIERKTEKANENRERLEGGKTREEEQERRDRENPGEHKINGKQKISGLSSRTPAKECLLSPKQEITEPTKNKGNRDRHRQRQRE